MAMPAPAQHNRHAAAGARSKQDLSPSRKRLLELMQSLNFGRIEHLAIVDGEPVFQPGPQITRDVKFGASNDARSELALDDFALKAAVRELFAEFAAIGDGIIDVLVVKHGLPFSMEVKENAADPV